MALVLKQSEVSGKAIREEQAYPTGYSLFLASSPGTTLLFLSLECPIPLASASFAARAILFGY